MQRVNFAYWVILHAFLSADFFKINFVEKFFQEYHHSDKQLDPDLAQHSVGPHLDPKLFAKVFNRQH